MKIRLAAVSALCSLMLCSGAAMAQAWPAKPIKVITVGAGTTLDVVVRMIGQGITGKLGQPVVIDNRNISIHPEDAIAKGVPDGYTLGYLANGVWIAPFLRADIPYDPLKDFAPVSMTLASPNIVTVNAAVPVKSVQELIALAKSKPEALNVFVTSGGGTPTLAAMLFQSQTGAKFTNVAYKSTAQGMNDLISGRLNVMFISAATAIPQMKAGKIKGLAVTSPNRSPQAPDLPTMTSFGYPNFVSVSAHALLAPPKTPAAIVTRLNREVVGFLTQPDVKAKMVELGFDVTASSPEELLKFMKLEMDLMGPVFKEAGIKPGDMEQ